MNAVPSVSWLFPPTAFHKLGPPRHGVSFTPSHGTRIAFPVFAASLDDEAGTNSPLSDSYGVSDPIKLAFERAKAYKKSKTQSSTMDSVSDTASQQQKKNVGDDSSSSVGLGGEDIPPSVKIAMDSVSDAASQQQKKNVGDDSSSSVGLGGENIPLSVKIAMEKAKEYAKEKSKKTVSLKDDTGGSNASVEGVSVDWRKERDEGSAGRISNERRTGTVSRLDFLGLNFADKKNSRGLPSGLVPRDDPFPPGELPEVEIIVGDQSKFASPTSPKPTEEDQNSELYKPKVSTWGVFPRPGDISKTYGGGRTIRPGEVLESAEAKAAKEARTRQLLSEYKVKMGLNIDPQIKSECQEDCLGAIDGTHIPAFVPGSEQLRYYNRKGVMTQNVLGVVGFDMRFHYIYAGWEGSASDSRVLQSALDDNIQPLTIPKGKYYLADGGYPLIKGFLTPYPKHRYHLSEFSGPNGNVIWTKEELFNHRHSSLRTTVERVFGVLKSRFPILKSQFQYPYPIQVKIVLATCMLHNFIIAHEPNDIQFEDVWDTSHATRYNISQSGSNDLNHQLRAQRGSNKQLRDSITNTMWNHFPNRPQDEDMTED